MGLATSRVLPVLTKDQVEELLRRAVEAAYRSERKLFRERAHERSIVFHIARHLAAEVYDTMPGWSVDVEYDRWNAEDLEDLKKRMDTAVIEAGLAEAGFQSRERATANGLSDVYPDIIVHSRTGLGAEHDLLVVEVKKEEAGTYEKVRDCAKLRGYRAEPFHYQYAVFMILPSDGNMPVWEWIT
jgi:hypothetical protein